MLTGTIILLLLSVVVCLAIGYLEGARVGTPVAGLAPVDAARTRLGVRLYYVSFAVAGIAALVAIVCAIGAAVSPTFLAAMPGALVASGLLLAVTAGTLVWSQWPRKAGGMGGT